MFCECVKGFEEKGGDRNMVAAKEQGKNREARSQRIRVALPKGGTSMLRRASGRSSGGLFPFYVSSG